MTGTLRVGLVGLGFGAEFVPIYLHHPDVASVTLCDPDPRRLAAVGEQFGIAQRTTDPLALFAARDLDAIHLITPIPEHAAQAVAVLGSGKHCACTVPMATTLDGVRAVVAAQRRSGKNFMMMETAVYTREFLFVRDLIERGDFGRVQLLRGAHYQDMERWPEYWLGLPPMHYATHAIAPLLALAHTRAHEVHCYGSGTMREELHARYGNPYPIETAIFRLDECAAAAEVTRALFETARPYTESFNVYGEYMTFEWQQIEEEPPVLFRMKPAHVARPRPPGKRRTPIATERLAVPDRQDVLPAPIARFTRRGVYDENNAHLSFQQGGGHGGSHPHLVHEFVRSIVEARLPAIDAIKAADWTAAGICAHESAMRGGAAVRIPRFDMPV